LPQLGENLPKENILKSHYNARPQIYFINRTVGETKTQSAEKHTQI